MEGSKWSEDWKSSPSLRKDREQMILVNALDLAVVPGATILVPECAKWKRRPAAGAAESEETARRRDMLREEVQKVKERKEKQRRKEKQEEQEKERKHQVTDWLKEADFELARALDGLPRALASIIDSGRLAPRCKTKVW